LVLVFSLSVLIFPFLVSLFSVIAFIFNWSQVNLCYCSYLLKLQLIKLFWRR
jgi:hypothetical protein